MLSNDRLQGNDIIVHSKEKKRVTCDPKGFHLLNLLLAIFLSCSHFIPSGSFVPQTGMKMLKQEYSVGADKAWFT